MKDNIRAFFKGSRRNEGEVTEMKQRIGERKEEEEKESGGDSGGATQHEHKRAVVSGRVRVPL